uniref:Pentacotripeptide-repeat region of PRORP domain-containing protein n=1 Tax=Trieres chinensis TaxID=1514140 RepID=A0A7S1ZQG4_TRICV|mmetsp:Transcript_31004/g.63418  ORF Transcript_31004/g.63418 Transcript_31004/m.63418 type:complete len:174 (+) Transcript_31004:297-818(+)
MRMLRLMEEVMPGRGHEPDIYTYNTVLDALARVGDVRTAGEKLVEMTNAGIRPDAFTVQHLADGLLNVGDVPGAVTLVQDMFNQHGVLPHPTTHLKVIEFALGNDLPYEAKRHVYFLQQIWKMGGDDENDNDDDGRGALEGMRRTKSHRALSKGALKELFRYFGEELDEEDFF